jgi:hypothetical protein
MITFVRTAVAAPGKLGEALMWGKEITAIVKRVTGKEMAIASPFGGAVTELAWIAQWDTVAQADEALSKLMTDRDYVSALAKAANLLIAGSARSRLEARLRL